MVFSSVIFTFLFLPIVLGLYFACRNDRWRNGVLLVSSLFFYWYGEHTFFFIMLASILGNYLFALLIDRSAGTGRRSGTKSPSESKTSSATAASDRSLPTKRR